MALCLAGFPQARACAGRERERQMKPSLDATGSQIVSGCTMFSGLKIAAVVPAYNEEKFIRDTLQTMPDCVDDVVVVDDCSADNTVFEVNRSGDLRITLIQHERNQGAGAAIVSGYREAMRRGADVAVVLAGDGQMDPAELTSLLTPIAADEADYVKGNRLSHPELAERMPFNRRLGNWALTWLTRRVTGAHAVTDSQCGYTAISRRALQMLPLSELWPRYGYPNDIISHLRHLNLRIADRPVTPIYGDEQSGIRPFVDLPAFGFVLGRSLVRNYLYR